MTLSIDSLARVAHYAVEYQRHRGWPYADSAVPEIATAMHAAHVDGRPLHEACADIMEQMESAMVRHT